MHRLSILFMEKFYNITNPFFSKNLIVRNYFSTKGLKNYRFNGSIGDYEQIIPYNFFLLLLLVFYNNLANCHVYTLCIWKNTK